MAGNDNKYHQIDTAQIGFIIQAIKSQLQPDEFYSKLIELVEKMTIVNTQMVSNQDELKRLIKDEVLVAFSNIKTIDSDFFKKTCERVNRLLVGDEYKFFDLIKEVRTSNIISFQKKAVVFLGVLGGTIALLGGVAFLWKGVSKVLGGP